MTTASERIKERARQTPLEVTRSVLDFFRDNPSSDDCYLFADGSVKDGEVFRAYLTTRLRALVSICTEGIPLHYSRWAVENRPLTIANES